MLNVSVVGGYKVVVNMFVALEKRNLINMFVYFLRQAQGNQLFWVIPKQNVTWRLTYFTNTWQKAGRTRAWTAQSDRQVSGEGSSFCSSKIESSSMRSYKDYILLNLFFVGGCDVMLTYICSYSPQYIWDATWKAPVICLWICDESADWGRQHLLLLGTETS